MAKASRPVHNDPPRSDNPTESDAMPLIPEGTPIEQNAYRQEALYDKSHPLHAYFNTEAAFGTCENMLNSTSNLDAMDYELIRQQAQSIAGIMLKVIAWTRDAPHWMEMGE